MSNYMPAKYRSDVIKRAIWKEIKEDVKKIDAKMGNLIGVNLAVATITLKTKK